MKKPSIFKSPSTSRRRLGIDWRALQGRVAVVIFIVAVLVALLALIALVVTVIADGAGRLNWQFLTSYASSYPERAGILAALVGTVYVVGIAAILTAPLGVAAAIYLEEFAPDTFLTRFINLNISNLAGVPSIVYGLLGFAIFVQILLGGQRGILAGSLTLTLLVLPIVIITTQEAIKAVPNRYRYAGYAMGATKWEVVRSIVMPQAVPGIMSGTILAYSRAVGETAPILAISSIVFITFLPVSLADNFTVIPLQIYSWIGRPQQEFAALAAAAIIVLLVLLLLLNSVAIIVRSRSRRYHD